MSEAMRWPAARLTRRTALATFATLALSACNTTTTEPPVAAVAAPPQVASAPLAPGKARVTVNRVSSLLYVGAPATIDVNGETVARLMSGETHVVDIPAGEALVAAYFPIAPGKFSVRLTAKVGERYSLEVSPRGASYLPLALGNVIGGAIDASVNENAGVFQIQLSTSANR